MNNHFLYQFIGSCGGTGKINNITSRLSVQSIS